MKKQIAEYDNGNVHVIRFDDGTVIRFSEDDEFNFAFPENMDVKICDRCDMQCQFCHEGSLPNGELGDILNAEWIESLHPYTEMAIGGGNALEHPDLLPFLIKLKEKKVFANLTVNQMHFLQNQDKLLIWSAEGLIHGLGVSLVKPTEELFEALKKFPNAVVHVIAGILTKGQLEVLMNHGKDIKLLILGYKDIRRGAEYYDKDYKSWAANDYSGDNINGRIFMLEEMMSQMFHTIKIVSFDCLAIEQLDVKDHLPPQVWDRFYQGEDGTMTFYIDMVNNQFAESSTAPFKERMPIGNLTVEEMFQAIKEKHNADTI